MKAAAARPATDMHAAAVETATTTVETAAATATAMEATTAATVEASATTAVEATTSTTAMRTATAAATTGGRVNHVRERQRSNDGCKNDSECQREAFAGCVQHEFLHLIETAVGTAGNATDIFRNTLRRQ
jgi:cell wall-associated NlpC family hydrolase